MRRCTKKTHFVEKILVSITLGYLYYILTSSNITSSIYVIKTSIVLEPGTIYIVLCIHILVLSPVHV